MLTPLPCRCSCPPRPPPLATCRLFEALAIDCGKLKVLAEAITAGYRQLPYHNAVHACDVAHGTFWLLKQQAPRPPPDDGTNGDKTKDGKTLTKDGKGVPLPHAAWEGATCDELMPPYALLAAVLAAPLHDINHDGHNNTYHQQSGSEWAMTYASAPLPFQVVMPLYVGAYPPSLLSSQVQRQVDPREHALRARHAAAAVLSSLCSCLIASAPVSLPPSPLPSLLPSPPFLVCCRSSAELDVLENLTLAERRKLRALVVESILGTDLAVHFEQLSQLQVIILCPPPHAPHHPPALRWDTPAVIHQRTSASHPTWPPYMKLAKTVR